VSLLLLGCIACGPDENLPGQRSSKVSAQERPNVLLVVLDTTRRDRLGVYGYDRATTPALDALATDGIIYDRAISAGSWTLPSHASIFTGLYPRDHGTTVEHWRLLPEFDTLAEQLKRDGFETVGVCSNPWVSANTGLQQGFDRFEEVWRDRKKDNRDVHGAALVTERLLGWLDQRVPSEHPFFAFVNYLEPHTPYQPPEPYRSRFLPKDADRTVVADVMDWETPREFGYILGVPGYEISAEASRVLSALYDAEVAYQDLRFGELIEGLRERGVLDDTIVVVVADHGEQLGEHGMLDHKMSLYAENVHVPLIIRFPKLLPQGVRIQAQVQSNDIYATILDLTSSDQPRPEGVQSLPFADAEGVGRPYAFVDMARPTAFLTTMEKEWPDSDITRFDRTIRSVRGPRFELFWGSDGERRLYDLESDPSESTDVKAGHPTIQRSLETVLDRFYEGAPSGERNPVELDEEHREALKSLGYVN
jgi:arylsulfatase A-like enzyme